MRKPQTLNDDGKCYGCPHLQWLNETRPHWCGKDKSFPRYVGIVPIVPKWCPERRVKA
jgi:hypothetical protein